MSEKHPSWLPEARRICRDAKIEIIAWGPDVLNVLAKSDDRAKQITALLAPLGFSVIADEDDSEAGMLSLSINPNAVLALYASFDVSRRRWNERLLPLIWAFCSLPMVPEVFGDAHPTPWISFPIGLFSAIMFFRDSTRIWGWRLELLPDGIRVRRNYCWSAIPWAQISSVQSVPRGRSENAVVVRLRSGDSDNLGRFFRPSRSDCAID